MNQIVFSFKESYNLNGLNEEQLAQLALLYPRFVFKYKPYYMLKNHPNWVQKFAPSWMCEYDPKWMVQNNSDWVAHNRPDILAMFDLDLLVEKNPAWVVNHRTELIAYRHPELLKEYDREIYQQQRPEEVGTIQAPIVKRFITKVLDVFLSRKTNNSSIPAKWMQEIQQQLQGEENKSTGPKAIDLGNTSFSDLAVITRHRRNAVE